MVSVISGRFGSVDPLGCAVPKVKIQNTKTNGWGNTVQMAVLLSLYTANGFGMSSRMCGRSRPFLFSLMQATKTHLPCNVPFLT